MTVVEWSQVGRGALDLGPVNATIGVFDGLHRGHQALIDHLLVRDNALVPAAHALVITFRQSPKKVLQADYPGDLMTWSRKLEVLQSLGVDVVVAIDFSAEFSKMAGRDFFLALKKSFVFSKLVLGWNFSFGRDSGTTAADLGWLADPQTRLTVVPPWLAEGGAVSSSRIRRALTQGDVVLANRLLGREHELPVVVPPTHSQGWSSVKRRDIPVLVPGPGRYWARLNERVTELHVTEDVLTWESPPGERLKHIVFVQGVQNGIE